MLSLTNKKGGSENKILIYKKHPACPRGSAGFTENFKRDRHIHQTGILSNRRHSTVFRTRGIQ